MVPIREIGFGELRFLASWLRPIPVWVSAPRRSAAFLPLRDPRVGGGVVRPRLHRDRASWTALGNALLWILGACIPVFRFASFRFKSLRTGRPRTPHRFPAWCLGTPRSVADDASRWLRQQREPTAGGIASRSPGERPCRGSTRTNRRLFRWFARCTRAGARHRPHRFRGRHRGSPRSLPL